MRFYADIDIGAGPNQPVCLAVQRSEQDDNGGGWEQKENNGNGEI